MGKESGQERCTTEWLRGKAIEAAGHVLAHHGGNRLVHGGEVLHDNRVYRSTGAAPCEVDFFHGAPIGKAYVAATALGDEHRLSAAPT